MPTSKDYEYMEQRLQTPVSRTHTMSKEWLKSVDEPIRWISRGYGDGTHWELYKLDGTWYLVMSTGTPVSKIDGKPFDKPIPRLRSGRE